MYAVIFEVYPKTSGKQEYMQIAARIRPLLEDNEGFISAERFQSLVDEDKILSLSFWEDEESIAKWRGILEHYEGQTAGKDKLFDKYRIRVAKVVRDYTDSDRELAP
ncbi:antibiotic biosynthesis monooxygenase family protein [Maridesulfovibrio sp.]|uniref:antibiotic biosynthesis monooxygenase family protein n=1 Tax=unclassified Maridesulfovibrio TaxID=2794999 RepID=UPI003AFFFAEF